LKTAKRRLSARRKSSGLTNFRISWHKALAGSQIKGFFMKLFRSSRQIMLALLGSLFLAAPVTAKAPATLCGDQLTTQIPKRAYKAMAGSLVMNGVRKIGGNDRDTALTKQIAAGNLPKFLRHLSAVVLKGSDANGKEIDVTICVMPDYLSVGSNGDFVRTPLGLPSAAAIADDLGFMLPTTKMVDAIYRQAKVHLAPSPMSPTNQMSSTTYLMQHNRTVQLSLAKFGHTSSALTAGQKKDLVLTSRLRSARGRVAIYGWHRLNGRPIQPLSTVHGAQYADYSHGIRLVSQTAYVNGKPQSLETMLQNPMLSKIVSNEGPIQNVQGLIASLYN